MVVRRRILLTGASGLLGSWLRRTAPTNVAIASVARCRRVDDAHSLAVDLREQGPVFEAVRQVRPDLVLHAAYAPDATSVVTATQHVASSAAEVGAELVLVSTDAVFAGDGVPRHEQDRPDPIFDYGRWKAEAERVTTEAVVDAAVVRLPLLVSLDPADRTVARVRATAATGERVVWFDDELRQPANAHDIAQGIWRLVSLPRDVRAGAWHLPGPDVLSRYELARRIALVLGIAEDEIIKAPTPPGVERPRHLHLLADRARRDIDWAPRSILAAPEHG